MNEDKHIETLAALGAIKGQQLGAVTFVQDYVQLAFDGPGLTAFNCPFVLMNDNVWKPASDFYRDRLCEQITKIVSDVELTNDNISIIFVDGSRVEVPLEIAEGCAEAAIFTNPAKGYTAVWN